MLVNIVQIRRSHCIDPTAHKWWYCLPLVESDTGYITTRFELAISLHFTGRNAQIFWCLEEVASSRFLNAACWQSTDRITHIIEQGWKRSWVCHYFLYLELTIYRLEHHSWTVLESLEGWQLLLLRNLASANESMSEGKKKSDKRWTQLRSQCRWLAMRGTNTISRTGAMVGHDDTRYQNTSMLQW